MTLRLISVLKFVADRTMDVTTNTFCAGGNVLANGTWVVFGGNQREYPHPIHPSLALTLCSSRHDRWCCVERSSWGLRRWRRRYRHPND